jgi:phage tail sheath gpL-like
VTVTVPGSAGVTTAVNGGTKEVDTLTVTAAAGTAGNVTITLNGVAVNIAVAAADATTTVATKIAAGTYTGWTASAAGAVVTFTKISRWYSFRSCLQCGYYRSYWQFC